MAKKKKEEPSATSEPLGVPEDAAPLPTTPDSENYDIVRVEEIRTNGCHQPTPGAPLVGADRYHLVLEASYLNCATCAFEGRKVMVFLDVRTVDALRWRRIDPHFRQGGPELRAAPPPAARFPATDEGWQDALDYARRKL